MLRQIIFSVFGILSLLYYALLCIRLRKWDSTFSRFWLVCGIAGLVFWYLCRDGYEILPGILMVIPAVIFVLTEARIIRGMFPSPKCPDGGEGFRYLIVLGAQVDGKRITDSLRRRLDRAIRYLLAYPATQVIVSGGMGKGEAAPEAEIMGEYLLEHGIGEERILREGRSRTTKENLEFSRAYIEDLGDPVGIVSNNFHLYRAICYAKREGYLRPCPVAADCHPLLFLNYVVREFFAVWKMWILCRHICSHDN
ncbi:MAG: YdcF family protein [Dorea sp.]|jgi:uncharacterized SAM-binding protein YcdF (DUF218 family)|nr:YdcF family protein [Dorea sp.]